jgi:hypothetical protein
MMDILRRIRVILDPKSGKELEQDTKQALDKGTDPKTPKKNLSAIESAMDRVKKAALGLGAAILGAFSIKAVSSFLKSSIQASVELETSRIRLAQALRNEGIEMAAVNGQLKELYHNLWDTHRLTEGEVNPVLQQLVTVTGDYDLSLRGVGIAANLAAAANMDVQSAARLVGRVMNGETGAVRRYLGEFKEGADVVALLEEKLDGMAKAATPATVVLGKAFGDLKEEIGFALREAINFDDHVGTMADRVERLKNNKELLVRAVRELVRALRDVLTVVVVLAGARGFMALRGAMLAANGGVTVLINGLRALALSMGPAGVITLVVSSFLILLSRMRDRTNEIARAANEAHEAYVAMLQGFEEAPLLAQLTKVQGELAKIQARLSERDPRFQAGEIEKAELLMQRIELSKQELEIQERLKELREPTTTPHGGPAGTGEAATPTTILPPQIRDMAGQVTRDQVLRDWAKNTFQTVGQVTSIWGEFTRLREEQDERMRASLEKLEDEARYTAYNMTEAFSAFFVGLSASIGDSEKFFDAFKQGAAGMAAAVMHELTKGKVELHMAEGAGMLARGLAPPGNPAFIASAVKHFAAAAAFKAIPGIVGGLGSRGGGGGSAGPTIPNPNSTTRPSASSAMGAEINIYIDPLNPSNPAWQSTLAQTLRGVSQRYGASTVNVKPRTS